MFIFKTEPRTVGRVGRQQILQLLVSTSVKSRTPKEGTEGLTNHICSSSYHDIQGPGKSDVSCFWLSLIPQKTSVHVCMYVSKNRIPFFDKSIFPFLNISSLCSQRSGVPDFLITVFQSTSYEFVLVQHVSNPIVRGHRSEGNKMNLPARQTVRSQLHL